MSATVFNRSWDLLLTTTLDNYRGTMKDNIHKGIALLYALTKRGRGQGVRYEDGGHHIMLPIITTKNPNTGTMAGYDRMTLAPTDEGTAAFEPWSNGYGTVGISRDEMRQNNGRHARANLLRTKVDVLEKSLKEFIETQFVTGTAVSTRWFVKGNGGKDFCPLGSLIAKDFTTAGAPKVHNIDPIVDSYWRNQLGGAAGVSATQGGAQAWPIFRAEISHLYNLCKRGSSNSAPDYGLTNQEVYEVIENGMIGHQRLPSFQDDEMESIGFETVRFKGMRLMWSELMPSYGTAVASTVSLTASATAGVLWMINTDALELVIDQETDFIITPFVEPVDQTAVWAKMLFRAQLTCVERRKLGLLFAINPANVTITL